MGWPTAEHHWANYFWDLWTASWSVISDQWCVCFQPKPQSHSWVWVSSFFLLMILNFCWNSAMLKYKNNHGIITISWLTSTIHVVFSCYDDTLAMMGYRFFMFMSSDCNNWSNYKVSLAHKNNSGSSLSLKRVLRDGLNFKQSAFSADNQNCHAAKSKKWDLEVIFVTYTSVRKFQTSGL